MNETTKAALQSIIAQFNQLIGDVSYKGFFSSYGLFHKKETMFAIWKNNDIYLRARDELAETLQALNCEARGLENINNRTNVKNYYKLSKEILDNFNELKKLTLLSIEQSHQEKIIAQEEASHRIKDMCSFNVSHERLLKKVKILTAESFREIGADESFLRLKRLGYSLSEEVYFQFIGAIENKNTMSFSEEKKAILRERLNKILEENGLSLSPRKTFQNLTNKEK